MIGLSCAEVRYSVCLIASTSGSRAACSRNASTEVANESYGWWTKTSPSRRTANRSSSPSPATSLGCVTGFHGSSFRSGRSSAYRAHRPA